MNCHKTCDNNFVCFDALHTSQQYFSCVGTIDVFYEFLRLKHPLIGFLVEEQICQLSAYLYNLK